MEIYTDRIKNMFSENKVAVVLGHVMAHEIVHILQSLDRHSEEGLMLSKWRPEDYEQMRRTPLTMTADDVRFIHDGLSTRRKLVVSK